MQEREGNAQLRRGVAERRNKLQAFHWKQMSREMNQKKNQWGGRRWFKKKSCQGRGMSVRRGEREGYKLYIEKKSGMGSWKRGRKDGSDFVERRESYIRM